MQEKRRILTALNIPDEVNSLEEDEHPKWTRQNLIELMQDLTATSTGVLDYNVVCFKFGQGVIKSMIKHNVIHLRTTSRLAYDVPNHADPIITAESPAAFVAMKKVLEECWKFEWHLVVDMNVILPMALAIMWYYIDDGISAMVLFHLVICLVNMFILSAHAH